jgi:hypothetical protein
MHPVQQRLVDIRNNQLEPLAKRLQIELSPRSSLTAPPMVLMLGNHSSGKSSMINHLLGRNIQRTGVAPTDDGFTFLLHGEAERNIDGQTLTTTPDLPFGELPRFGPGLVQHCYGRFLDVSLLQHVRLIDSPGMIDAAGAKADRPYDFLKVVRWMAERCDLVLLFFDPEKPGTTGETLHVLTEALHGVDHKLHIVMNKMDLFEGLRDFARTYGALCWNLSRSLPTKDMPHIYTTVIPELARNNSDMPLETFAAALLELEQYINELPQRRIDTAISTVMEEAQHLSMRTRIVQFIRRRVRYVRNRVALAGLAIALCLGALGSVWYQQQQDWSHWLGAYVLAIVILAVTAWLQRLVGNWVRRSHTDNLDRCFQIVYHKQLEHSALAEDLRHLWSSHKPSLIRSFRAVGLDGIQLPRRGQIKALDQLTQDELPKLR